MKNTQLEPFTFEVQLSWGNINWTYRTKTTLPGSQARTYLWQHQLGSIGLLGDQIVPIKEQTRHRWSSSLDARAVFLSCGKPSILSYDNKTEAKRDRNFHFNPWTRKVKDAQTKSNFFSHNSWKQIVLCKNVVKEVHWNGKITGFCPQILKL